MRKNKVDIAVIDSGIFEGAALKGKIAAKADFLALGDSNTDPRSKQSACVHGTTCAEIISYICPEAHFWDLTAVEPDGTTHISKLLEALDWCAHQKVQLIHLSLGTVDYFDVKPLEERMRNLLRQNVFIVAAYHNLNIRTYPAAFPGVFGVRQDREGILEENKFLFQEQQGYCCENTIVAHWWGDEGAQRSNSYAAPVITGYIARALCEYEEVDFHAVLKFLKKNAESGRKYSSYIARTIPQREHLDTGVINVPVIATAGISHEVIRMLISTFEDKDFHTLLLQEKGVDEDAVPMDYYGGNHCSFGQMLYTVDHIYKPDIIFLDFIGEGMFAAAEKAETDMLITCDKDTYTITAEGLMVTVKEPGEIYEMICRYFECR